MAAKTKTATNAIGPIAINNGPLIPAVWRGLDMSADGLIDQPFYGYEDQQKLHCQS